jgi:low temperature requirement protein LtrA
LTVSVLLLFLSAFVPQLLEGNVRITVYSIHWMLAIGVAYLAVIQPGALTIVSAGHWADRHAQIILIALGESILSLGIGSNLARGATFTVPLLVAMVLGILLICSLWWTYFDARSFAAARVLHRTEGKARIRLARDAYTLIHFPMIFGIILLSIGIKQILSGSTPSGESTSPDPTHLRLLYGGVLLYLAALLAFQVRTLRRFDRFSLVPLGILTGSLPFLGRIPPLGALALLTLVTVGGVLIESHRARPSRQLLRGERLTEQQAFESNETDWRRRNL